MSYLFRSAYEIAKMQKCCKHEVLKKDFAHDCWVCVDCNAINPQLETVDDRFRRFLRG